MSCTQMCFIHLVRFAILKWEEMSLGLLAEEAKHSSGANEEWSRVQAWETKVL